MSAELNASSKTIPTQLERAGHKKGKDNSRSEAIAPLHVKDSKMAIDDGVNGDGNSYEHPHIRELQKNIRNITKKLANMQKLDTIISANPNMTLEDLVATKKINSDQKAQALNKPLLQTSLNQLEEQLSQFRKIEDDFRQRLATEIEEVRLAHAQDLKVAEEKVRAELSGHSKSEVRHSLLLLSKFLRAAAARRQMDNEETNESRAFEGVLLLMYGGDSAAVDAAEKLIAGSKDTVPSTEGAMLDVTYEHVRQTALAYSPPSADETLHQITTSAVEPPMSGYAAESDPTLAHAGLTEVEAHTRLEPMKEMEQGQINSISQEIANTGLANNTAAAQWEQKVSETSDMMGESWVDVSRPPEAGASDLATPVLGSTAASQNWADEAPELRATPNDGFHEVHHGRARSRGALSGDYRGGRGRGVHRGEGGRGRYRGDGGSGRGRGRGGRGRETA